MVDTSEKGSKCEEMICQTPTTPERLTSDGSNVRTCVTCGTFKTPLWRGGPAGPKSLCNACGIRSGKKIRALMGVTKKSKKTATNLCNSRDSCTSSSGESTLTRSGDFANKKKLWVFGKDLGLKQKPRSSMKRSRVSEVERAAILLMALSCGSVYASETCTCLFKRCTCTLF